ncbi:myelin-associated glycoprotein-like isoform X2 [Heptranchias perlo]|uniref:myelin-associated glycoprotein-like isoform X2 n=1 Tax=Heptranchias perlo TaxID=212740 RepID=UPI00355A442E
MSRPEIAACFLALVQGAWCLDWSASIPTTVTAQRGLCAVIPCTYHFPSNVQPTKYVGIWYKNRQPSPVYDSNKTHQVNDRIKLGGDLRSRDCSLVINDIKLSDRGLYRFRIELGASFKYSYPSNVQLLVSDRPDKPIISHSEDIIEGDPVNISCTFVSNCDRIQPTLKWNLIGALHGSASQMKTEQQNRSWVFSTILTFVPSFSHQNKVIRCKVKNSGVLSYENITLNIKHSPKETAVRVVGADQGIKEGDNVTLSCFSKSNPPATNYSWFRIDGSNRTELNTRTASINLGLVTRELDAWFYCTAGNTLGSSNSIPFFVSVEYPPKETAVRVVGAEHGIKEGDNVTLSCFSKSNPPATNYSWFRIDGSNRTELNTRTASINLGLVTRELDAWFYCTAGNTLGSSNSTLFFVSVEYRPKVLLHSNCTRAAAVTCVCSVRANPPARTWWLLDQRSIHGNYTGKEFKVSSEVRGQEARSTLTVKRSDGNFNALCVGSNRQGKDTLKFYLFSKDVGDPLWMMIKEGLYGGLVTAGIMCSLCLLMVILQKRRVRECNRAPMDTARHDPVPQIVQDTAADAWVYENPQESSGQGNGWQDEPETQLYANLDCSKPPVSDGFENTDYAPLQLSPREV